MVFEEHVAYYLDRYLGNYVKGLSKEALKISVWQGNVELTNMQLKPEALNSLKLPIKVKAGFLGSVKLKVPWSRLGQEPVVVLLDRIFLLAEPATDLDRGSNGDAVQEAKMKRVKDTEIKLLERKADDARKEELNNTSWLGSLISTIIGNLKLSITNVHIRYEDCESNPGHPFAAGLTLEKLAAVTVDEEGKEMFITGGSLDRIQKSGELQRLAFYFDPDTEPWKPEKKWEDLLPKEWAKVFGQGVGAESVHGDGSKVNRSRRHQFLLAPVGGTARYNKLANKDTRTPEEPAQKAIVTLDSVTIGLSEVQYRDALKLMENFSTFNKRLKYAHYRPSEPIKENRRGWWQYAYKAILEQLKQASGSISWKRLVRLSELRKRYVSKYVMALQSNPKLTTVDDDREIQDMDRELDTDIIIQWRMLAHTYVDQSRAQDQRRQQQQQKQQSWWLPFGWGGQSNEEDEKPVKFTDEEWEQLNQLIGYQQGKQSNVLPGQEPPNMLHTVLEVRMRRNATKLVADNDDVIMELSGAELHVNLHIYPKTTKFDLELASYELSCPEGLLMESATKAEAVNATFIYLPMEGNLDWSLAAKCSPCYVTVFMPSVNRVIAFFRSSRAVSRTVALDTATALQSTLDEVTRNAQQQINKALKDRPRFKMDLDIAAPKVTIPTDFYPDGIRQSKLLLDFGHFNLKTDLDDKPMESAQEKDLYMRFRMKLTDVSAVLVDGDYDWKHFGDFHQAFEEGKSDTKAATMLPLLEKCGMMVALQQICVPHPQYPTTRVAVRLPSIAFQFSPARYHRIMQVTKVFQSSSPDDTESASVRPWEPSDFEGHVSVLAWKGVGHREAVWQRRYAVLSGPFLYLLESPSSQSYKYCTSLIGKQASVVPPESIGDVPYVLAVCDAGQFKNKVAESVNALLMRFDDEMSMNNWQARITGAIYRASAPVALAGFVGSKEHEDAEDAVLEASQANEQMNPAEQESFFLTGALDELKIVISNSKVDDYSSPKLLLGTEIRLLELRAIGTKVEFAMRTYDMTVGAVLQALEVEDKFHGHVSPSCKYLARSYIKTSPKTTEGTAVSNGSSGLGKQHRHKSSNGKTGPKRRHSSGTDRFFDAEEEFLDAEDQSKGHTLRGSSGSLSKFFDAKEEGNDLTGDDQEPPSFRHDTGLLPLASLKDDDQNASSEGEENFVKAQVIMRSQDSPDYGNVDKQVRVTLATLSFFSNRPTLLALLDLVTAINADVEPKDPNPPPTSTESDAIVSTIDPNAIEGSGEKDDSRRSFDRHDSVIKGLLGRGKNRVVFLVVLNMDRAEIFLNLEDGARLSVLSQEDLRAEIKVFPASFGIKVALGNLKVSDGSLDDSHPYHYICNMRDPQGTSFIELEFLSFNKEDEDYEGYEYSMEGKLSELRIVYLNRFTQEISSYFMGLVPQNSGYVVKLKDRFTDVEKFFTQSEIEGQPALKLDLSLSKPVIIMPRSTTSTDFLELDILHINVFNSFQWLGGEKDELGAVRLETTTLQLEDLHLVVGVGGKTGEGIIQEAKGLSLVVRRPIRDLWHQLPAVEAAVKIESLKAALSDTEYQVITECAVTNMAETSNLPPPVIEKVLEDDKNGREIGFHARPTESNVEERPRADNNSGSGGETWTTIKIGVGIENVELGLFKGKARDAPLASVQVRGVWAAFKSNSVQESTIMASLQKFSVRDDREGTELEMRYMIGNADEENHDMLEAKVHDEDNSGSSSKQDSRPSLTRLVMDANLSPTSQTITLRIQRPRLLVALDFLLAVAEFFIPSMHAMLSDGKAGDENPLEMQNAVFLNEPVYKQSEKDITLSPKRPLVADKMGISDYVYDGRGGTIRLLDRKGVDLRDFAREVIIFVGDCKRLTFKNVVIQNGDFLDSCISLGSNSSYSASEDDGVFLEGQPEKPADAFSHKGSATDGQEEHPSTDQGAAKPIVETIFNLQAIAPELTFYDSMKTPADSVLVPERLLRARMNVFSRFILKGEDMELNAQVNGLTVEASSGIHVLEPVDMTVKYTKVAGKQHVHVAMSEVVTNFSFSVVHLILRLQTDVMSFLRITSEQATVRCSEFDKIWADDDEKSGANCITFWRPRAPPGFAILGDCLTPRDETPSKGVIAVNMSLARLKRPVDFLPVWSSYENVRRRYGADDDDQFGHCSVWFPVAPRGYIALGCVASPGRDPPPQNACFCVLAALVTPCQMRDCIIISLNKSDEAPDVNKLAFWRVDNSTGSFFTEGHCAVAKSFQPHELRQIISSYDSFPVQETKPPSSMSSPSNQQTPLSYSSPRQSLAPSLSSGRMFESIARFELIWWSKGSGSKKGISIWRPVVPAGCVILGDIAVEGYLPPDVGLALRETEGTGHFCKPLRFYRRGQISRRKSMGTVSFWFPVAPVNYVAMGCIASTTSNSPPDAMDIIRCVRKDLVVGANFSSSSLWDTSGLKSSSDVLSIWPVENEAHTFFVIRKIKTPPKELALRLAEYQESSAPDNLISDVEVKRISATFFDDFGGLMAPLVDISLSGITGSLHGRMEAMSCTANFTLTAASFNGKYRVWEPLVEPWDGRLRYAYSSDPENKARPTVKHVRLAASSDLNINLSTANANMFLEAYASWNRMNRLEDKTKKQFSLDSRGRWSSKPALDVKGQENLSCVNHNELGVELFLRIVEKNHSKVLIIPPGGSVSVRLPTAHSIGEPGAKATSRRNPNKFVALKIGDAQVPRDEGIGGRDYMVALRVVPRAQSSDQRQLQYQSARTRCAAPETSASSDTVTIIWNEIFVFEVETEEGNSAEIVITDVSRGAPVGFCLIQLTQRKTKHSIQESETHVPWSEVEPEWELVYPTQSELMEGGVGEPCGKISVAKQFFSIVAESLKDGTSQESGTLQFSLTPEGPWNEVGLNYALGAAPWQVNDDTIATEFYVDGGVKHLLIRSLVVVQNATDFEVEVSLCAVSALDQRSSTVENGDGENVEEEVFENERYQPLAGWGNKWPGHLLPTDPGRYSNRHVKASSEEFPAVKLPPGWKWTSDWHVDKGDGVDEEGWYYAFDFHNMTWPPPTNGSGNALSFVRRRRWVRSRESVTGGRSRVNVGTLPPGGTMPLPIACLRATSSDYCLQVKPRFGGYNSGSYQWSHVDSRKGFPDHGLKHELQKEIKIQALVETEELLKCSTEASSSSSSDKDIWFCLEVTGTAVGKDAEMDPIKDWKLVITAPLMLRNYLPVPSEYSVYEKHTGRGLLVRERGIIKSGEAAGIFHADLNKALHLTWLPQGGWQPKKETVLISHPYRDVAIRMSYISSRTSRSMEVMIEHDHEVKGVAAKVVKMYVPCWLDSAKCPPLQFRLMDIQQSGEPKPVKGSEQDHRTQPIEGVTMGKVKEQINQEEMINNQTVLSDIDLATTGLSVVVTSSYSEHFGPVSPLGALSDPDGSTEVKGLAEHGSYYRFLVTMTSCPLQFVKTKVLRIRPYILFTNWVGQAMYMKQKGNDDIKTLHNSDWRVSFPFMEAEESGLLQIKLDGCQWSYPFPVDKETSMYLALRKEGGGRRSVRIEIRGYEEGSRFLVLFRLGSARGPYRLDNRTSNCFEIRQYGLDGHGWQSLQPHSTKTFAWEDYCREQLLEVVAGGNSVTLDVNKIGDHPPVESGQDSSTLICIRVLELMDVKTVRFYEETRDTETFEEGEISSSNREQVSVPREEAEDEASAQTEIVVDIPKLGLSVIDHKPQEILYLFLGEVLFTYQMGFGERISGLKLRIGDMQLDNQLPLTWMPVLLAPEGRSEEKDFLLTATLTMYDDNTEATRVFPYIGVQVQSGLRVNVHEPIIWAIVDMYNNLHLDRLSEGSEVVQVDPEFRIDLIDVSEVRLKLTLETAPAARPRGMLGYWGPLVTGLGNTNKMPIRLSNVLHKDRYIRRSQIGPAITSRIRRDLIHQPLLLLTGVDLFGNASSTIGTLSKGAAQLSSDGKYLRLRSKKDRARNLSGIGDGLLQGTEALARGFAYGLTGVVTKPFTSARQYGFVGFFQGVGKAAVGFVMLPVSGMLEFVSLTVNGVGVSCTNCFEIFDADSHVTRVRAPRAIRGDGILERYDEFAALGQALLQLAQSGALFGFREAFSEPAKYAWSDFYENHVDLPRHRVLMLTNRRVMMLARPASHFQKPEKIFTDPCSILWEVPWRNVLAVEIAAHHTHFVILHLRWSTKSFAQVIKCYERSLEGRVSHAKKVARSIREVWKKYGPDRQTVISEESRHAHHLRLLPASFRSKRSNPGSMREDGLVESSSPAASRGVARGYPVGSTHEAVLFKRIWTSEQEAGFSCSICSLGTPAGELCTLWRPQAPEGYVSVGDIAHHGIEPPAVAVTYKREDGMFAKPTGYDLVWRNWKDGFLEHISIWMPRAPHGYVALGCVAVSAYMEPEADACWCIREELTEHTDFEESVVWQVPASSPWNCYIYAITCEALTFLALRETEQNAGIRPRRVKLISSREIDVDDIDRV